MSVIERPQRYEPIDVLPPAPQKRELQPLPFTMFGDIDPVLHKRWTIDDVLGAGELSVWFGAPGSGKSVMAGDAACHVAADMDWHGRRVERCAVLYIAAERAALVERRFAAWRMAHGVDHLPLAVVSANLDFCSTDGDVKRVIATAKAMAAKAGMPVGWIIVDTMARTMGAGDENSGKDVGSYVNNLALLQATGAHVTVIHHVPHGEQTRMRGHSALLGAADATFRIEHDKATSLRSFKIDKVNDGRDDLEIAFTLESITLGTNRETGKETTAPVVRPDSRVTGQCRTSKPVRLSDREELALRALHDAVGEDGQAPPPGFDLPAGIRVVSIDSWRNACYRSQIAETDKADTRRKAFKRAVDHLQRLGLVGVLEGWAWLV